MPANLSPSRKNVFLWLVALAFLIIILRLFYWQVWKSEDLRRLTSRQALREKQQVGLRGEIYSSDGYLLVGNQPVYDLKLDKNNFQGDALVLSQTLAEIIAEELWQYQDASSSSEKATIKANLALDIHSKFNARGNWPKLAAELSQNSQQKIAALNNPYLAFDQNFDRFYAEASMAAHLTGFVGRDEEALPIGRYGIEGALEEELKPRSQSFLVKTDALGYVLAGEKYDSQNLNGRNVTLTIRRDLQNLAEESLKWGIDRYQAERGEIIIMDSQSGKILALATWPNYQQWQYFKYPAEILKNPSLTRNYEPGSTLKVLTVAAAIDAGVITPETVCSRCAGPRQVANYTIHTWNDVYNPNITITEALEKSDNTAMVFVSDLLGKEKLLEYLRKFGLGRSLNINLQDNATPPFPQQVGPVETATISFGQGIVTNSLQLLRAVNVIAHDGILLEPSIVEKVYDQQSQQEIVNPPQTGERVISSATAQTLTKMMIDAAAHGEAQWIASDKYLVAAKTGTSQVPDPAGGYKSDETIASFIGFAPASQPRFTMLVKLEHPKSSPWAAETAAPLWYRVADRLMMMLNIEPDK